MNPMSLISTQSRGRKPYLALDLCLGRGGGGGGGGDNEIVKKYQCQVWVFSEEFAKLLPQRRR